MHNFLASRGLSRRTFLSTLMTAGLALVPLVILSGCGGGGGGGNNNNNNNNNNGGNATISGRVFNSTDADSPVEGATVVIGGKTVITRTVDNASADTPTGSFVIEGAPVGTNLATVTPVGGTAQIIRFAPPLASGTNSPIELFINIGQISGRVLLPNGQPASGAFVTVSSTGDSTTTDSTGAFFLPIIPVGATQISAVLGTASKSQAITVNVGNTNVGDVTLVDDPNPNPPGIPNTIVGTVTIEDVTGATIPASSTTVNLLRNNIQIETTTTDANGGYGFYVPVGSGYSVVAIRSGFQNTQSGTIAITNPSVPVVANLNLPSQ